MQDERSNVDREGPASRSPGDHGRVPYGRDGCGRGRGQRAIISRTPCSSGIEILDQNADAAEDASPDILEAEAEQKVCLANAEARLDDVKTRYQARGSHPRVRTRAVGRTSAGNLRDRPIRGADVG
ncbi:hypothetical protein HIM_11369 [Hirsutella minnesotensis 3608]|uniref:Uncharacterized protein n=1 Tax=Hirsutella minnesotensis 3608 TaxID=1043627 RepID=A0A0F7ZFJ4_9HYPO|nr:hypothetical protein HIM_11369 [Hirsutella minnesotensis 3608]